MKIHEKKVGDPGLLKHICDYCRTEFSSAEALSMHIKQHSGSKPFVCNVCTKCFPQRFNLELHLRVHTGKNYFCVLHNIENGAQALQYVVGNHTLKFTKTCKIIYYNF